MKKLFFCFISFIVLFSMLNAAIGFKSRTVVKGKVSYINIAQNYIKINNSKYFYFDAIEPVLEDYLNKNIIINVIKKDNRFIILKIVNQRKNVKKQY